MTHACASLVLISLHLDSAKFPSLDDELQSLGEDEPLMREHYCICRQAFSGMYVSRTFALDRERICADRVECGKVQQEGAPVFLPFQYHSLSPGMGKPETADVLLSAEVKATFCFWAKHTEGSI